MYRLQNCYILESLAFGRNIVENSIQLLQFYMRLSYIR